jgi:D-glucosaminate-6-phosphate ammonia-lyase
VIIRDHEVELGFFEMDPCNLHEGEETIVASRVVAELEAARARNDKPTRSAAERKVARFERLLRWPD